MTDNWISAKEQLPIRESPDHKARRFLVHMTGGIIEPLIYLYDDKRWTENGDTYYQEDRITHWMPLPEPPEDNK